MEFTYEEIMAMSDDEIHALNRKYGMKLLKQIAIKTAITVGAIVVVSIVANKIAKNIADED